MDLISSSESIKAASIEYFKTKTEELNCQIASIEAIKSIKLSVRDNLSNIFRSTHITDYAFILSSFLKGNQSKAIGALLA